MARDIPRVYSKAIRQILASDAATDQADTIYELTVECDRLTATIVEDAEIVAKRFMTYADRVAAGEMPPTPTRYTTASDIDANEAKLHEKLRSIYHLLRCCYGRDKTDEWSKALSETRAAAA